MRRITLAAMSTLSLLVLLLSYRTSLGEGATATAQVGSPARIVAAAPSTTKTTTAAGNGPDPRSAATTTSSSAITSSAPTTAAGTSASGAGSTSSAAPKTSDSASSTPSAASPVTAQGAAEMTPYGAVQVQVTIKGGAITDVTAIDYPTNDGRDRQINSVAVPQLQNQVLSAQSARVQGVSGATYTTEGFVASVQSALDAAGFAG